MHWGAPLAVSYCDAFKKSMHELLLLRPYTHTHKPVAEVVFVIASNKGHGELVGSVGVKHVQLLGGR